MLTKDIVLPEYQRHFVWRERDVKRLIQSLTEGQFVHPVTIALYNDGTEKYNFILVGQQRLTSIYPYYLLIWVISRVENRCSVKTAGAE